ncbi:hypothetical protein ACFX1X_032382 [Malus domestica]
MLSRHWVPFSNCSQVTAVDPRPENRRSPTILRILIRRPIEPQLELTDSVTQALQEQLTPEPLDSLNHPVRKKRRCFDWGRTQQLRIFFIPTLSTSHL